MNHITILNYDLVCNRKRSPIELKIDELLNTHDVLLNQRLINNCQNWEVTGAFSPLVTNCIEWLPIEENEQILEIGAGYCYGNITETLSGKARNVYALEIDYIKCQMIETRTSDKGNVDVILGHIDDLAKSNKNFFSKIILVESFTKIEKYFSEGFFKTNNLYEEALRVLFTMLSPKGEIIIVDDNKLGLKYFNGARLDKHDALFGQIENNVGSNCGRRLLSKNEYNEIFKLLNVSYVEYYYPYPDYKYTETIYSDKNLPANGDLNVDIYNWEQFGLNQFRDSKVYNTLVKEKLFDHFSNSYLIILSNQNRSKLPSYIKYSNDRSYKFQIRTEIWKDNNKKLVKKKALTQNASVT